MNRALVSQGFRGRAVVSCALAVVAAACSPVWGQGTVLAPSFEAASLKRSSGMENPAMRTLRGGPGTASPGRITYIGLDLSTILQIAYAVERYQIEGPAWLGTETFDVVANVPSGATRDQFRVMLQNLLADRLSLRAHREPREVNAFDLVVAKGGVKMREAVPIPPDEAAVWAASGGIRPARTQMVRGGGERLIGDRLQMDGLALTLTGVMGRPVVDRTGLAGAYDFVCEFEDPHSKGSGAGISVDVFDALRDVLGLRLEPAKARIEFLVVDHVEKVPAPN